MLQLLCLDKHAVSQVVSDLETWVILCDEMVAGCVDARKVVSGGEFDKKFKDVWYEDVDEWALAVQGRMNSVSDLFAADVTRLVTTDS